MPEPVFPPTRWSLVRRATHGGAPQLVERYADCLRTYLRLKFPDLPTPDFDDLIQEVLLHLLTQPDLLTRASERSDGKFRYYLATIAFNQARNVVRWQRRTAIHEQAFDHDPVAAAEVDQAWETTALAAAWTDVRGWVASGELDGEAVDLLERQLMAGIPLRQLAEEHGLSLATCQRRVAKARTWLHDAFHARLASD